MRTIVVVYLSILLIVPTLSAGPATADDTAKPFSEMTISELTAIDVKALSKADKKLHKKALRAAKKIEKARKKVEKKRARAEEKRLKAEAKRIAKLNKATLSQLQFAEDIYRDTKYRKDEFEAQTGVNAPAHSGGPKVSYFSIANRDLWYRMRAVAYPERGEYKLSVYVSKKLILTELNKLDVQLLSGSPENYVTRNRYWQNYSYATMRGGVPLEFKFSERYLDNCSDTQCNFREDAIVAVTLEQLQQALEKATPLEFKVFNELRNGFVVSVHPGYIIGFLKRLSELSPSFAPASHTAQLGLDALNEQLVPNPK